MFFNRLLCRKMLFLWQWSRVIKYITTVKNSRPNFSINIWNIKLKLDFRTTLSRKFFWIFTIPHLLHDIQFGISWRLPPNYKTRINMLYFSFPISRPAVSSWADMSDTRQLGADTVNTNIFVCQISTRTYTRTYRIWVSKNVTAFMFNCLPAAPVQQSRATPTICYSYAVYDNLALTFYLSSRPAVDT